MRSSRRYTHDDTGLIHVEADVPANYTLGRLFTVCVPVPDREGGRRVALFHRAAERCGYPAALLSDNAAVFSGASRHGKVLLESECAH
jgi:hypothetical protein